VEYFPVGGDGSKHLRSSSSATSILVIPRERISKEGDEMLRRLLVGSAHYILGPFGRDSDLRRHGEKIASRGAKNAKKRAAVAVARKLSVLLHHLWISGEVYEPLYNTGQPKDRAA
jgi:transposase